MYCFNHVDLKKLMVVVFCPFSFGFKAVDANDFVVFAKMIFLAGITVST